MGSPIAGIIAHIPAGDPEDPEKLMADTASLTAPLNYTLIFKANLIDADDSEVATDIILVVYDCELIELIEPSYDPFYYYNIGDGPDTLVLPLWTYFEELRCGNFNYEYQYYDETLEIFTAVLPPYITFNPLDNSLTVSTSDFSLDGTSILLLNKVGLLDYSTPSGNTNVTLILQCHVTSITGPLVQNHTYLIG